MKWQNLNKGVLTLFHQTESNNFDDASVVLGQTSIREKVNHLWRSDKQKNKQKTAPLKNKEE